MDNVNSSSILNALVMKTEVRVRAAGESQDDATIRLPVPRSEEQGGGFDVINLSNDNAGKWLHLMPGATVVPCGYFKRTDTYLCAIVEPHKPGEQAKVSGAVLRNMSWIKVVAGSKEPASSAEAEALRARGGRRPDPAKEDPKVRDLRRQIAELEAKVAGRPLPPPEADQAAAQEEQEDGGEPISTAPEGRGGAGDGEASSQGDQETPTEEGTQQAAPGAPSLSLDELLAQEAQPATEQEQEQAAEQATQEVVEAREERRRGADRKKRR